MYNIVLSALDSVQCANKAAEKPMSSACSHEHVVLQEESHMLLWVPALTQAAHEIFSQ